jgi:DNA adenine methylase
VEPCGGAASVLLQKPRSPLETYNDLDGNVVNFFRVLRDRPDELIRKIRLTPWARAEYELSLEPCEDEVEAARRFAAMQWMAVAGQPSGWRKMHDYRARRGATAFDLCNVDFEKIVERFIGVQIESIDALDCIKLFDNDATLTYFDPPYVVDTRSVSTQYLIEVDNDFHIEAAALLRQCAGYVVVSGYACPLYADLYEAHGWHRVDKEAQTNSGGKRIESLWISPRTWAALHNDFSNLALFNQNRKEPAVS